MNYPSRNDEVLGHEDWNQSPQYLNSDATTRADLIGIVNTREYRESDSNPGMLPSTKTDIRADDILDLPGGSAAAHGQGGRGQGGPGQAQKSATVGVHPVLTSTEAASLDAEVAAAAAAAHPRKPAGFLARIKTILKRYGQFIGPGFLISVAYIDPGNYATDVQAGASTRYGHLFMIFMSNVFAIFLQSLCIKLGTVTGVDLAVNCRLHLPRWMTWVLYLLSEAAIIATDIAEVIGSAIALNLLLHVPLVAGCAITLVDVLLLLIFYRPDGKMGRLRLFEYFVMGLVLGVVVCFCIQLSYIRNTTLGQVFRGFLPSGAVVDGDGVYLSCGILGATVMPHSIILGSGVVQPRLREFDEANGLFAVPTRQQPEPESASASVMASAAAMIASVTADESDSAIEKYRPSIAAIRSCLTYSVVELVLSLLTFALFVNSAILIVSGAALYPSTAATQADLFGIYELLSQSLSKAAGTIFALALLLSGTSAGIVCTMAGQMVSEGMVNWTIKPWLRRLVTRSISIVPAIVVAAAVGREGLNETLVASQVVLSAILPFVTAPLLWFTCRSKYMMVQTDSDGRRSSIASGATSTINMRNGFIVSAIAILIWLVLVVMNVALLVLVGLGKA